LKYHRETTITGFGEYGMTFNSISERLIGMEATGRLVYLESSDVGWMPARHFYGMSNLVTDEHLVPLDTIDATQAAEAQPQLISWQDLFRDLATTAIQGEKFLPRDHNFLPRDSKR
jgi:hypothetical protein